MKTLLEYLQDNNKTVSASCNGQGKCGKCIIKVTNRELSISNDEQTLLTSSLLEQGYRLACKHQYHEGDNVDIENKQYSIKGDISLKRKNKDKHVFGIILDIGTTTLVGKLIDVRAQVVDTKSICNPQTSYGADVISRIAYDKNHPHHLHQIIKEAIATMISSWMIYPICQMIVCGNSVMTHLFLDEDIQSIGVYPFIPLITTSVHVSSKKLLETTQDFDIYCFPPVSAFVGGDIVAGIYGLFLEKLEDDILFLDLGTNGEMVVKKESQFFACSAPAGPAFEGCGITCGSGSVKGAIYQVKEVGNKLVCKTIGDSYPASICGTGLISLIAYLRRNEIIDEIGNFYGGQDQYVINEDVYLTKKDIQTFLLAKAAIQVSVEILLEQNPSIKTIYLSGGFSNSLEVDDLKTLQILKTESAIACCNTALQGTYELLLSEDYAAIESLVNSIDIIDLKTYPSFNDRLVEALFL